MTDDRPRALEPDASGDLALREIVKTAADAVEVGQPDEHAPASGRVLEDSQTGQVWLGTGTAWRDIDHTVGMDLAGLPGVKVVRSADDLPDASGGVRQLEAGTSYLFADFVSDPATLELAGGDGSPLLGWHGGQSGYIHTGGGTVLQGTDAPFFARDATFSGPGATMFDLSADATTEMLVESCSFSDPANLGDLASLGTVDGYRVPSFKGCNFESFEAGITFTGTSDKVFISESPFREPVGPGVQCITFAAGADVALVDIAGCYGKGFQADTEFVHTEAGGEPSEVLQLRGTMFDTDTTVSNVITGALDETSVGVSVVGSWPLADSRPGVSYALVDGGEGVVTITAQDPGDGSEAVLIDRPTTAFPPVTDRFTHTSPNRATYTGRRRFVETVSATVSVSGSNTTVALYIVKNGTLLDRSKVDITTASAGQPRTVSITARIELLTDDYLELWLANEGGTGDITVSTLEVTI